MEMVTVTVTLTEEQAMALRSGAYRERAALKKSGYLNDELDRIIELGDTLLTDVRQALADPVLANEDALKWAYVGELTRLGERGDLTRVQRIDLMVRGWEQWRTLLGWQLKTADAAVALAQKVHAEWFAAPADGLTDGA
jgi:hypothetical protein